MYMLYRPPRRRAFCDATYRSSGGPCNHVAERHQKSIDVAPGVLRVSRRLGVPLAPELPNTAAKSSEKRRGPNARRTSSILATTDYLFRKAYQFRRSRDPITATERPQCESEKCTADRRGRRRMYSGSATHRCNATQRFEPILFFAHE